MDEQVKAMQDQIMDAVANLGAVEVIKALAAACRMAAEVDNDGRRWTSAGTHSHYAQILEDLIPVEQNAAPNGR